MGKEPGRLGELSHDDASLTLSEREREGSLDGSVLDGHAA